MSGGWVWLDSVLSSMPQAVSGAWKSFCIQQASWLASSCCSTVFLAGISKDVSKKCELCLTHDIARRFGRRFRVTRNVSTFGMPTTCGLEAVAPEGAGTSVSGGCTCCPSERPGSAGETGASGTTAGTSSWGKSGLVKAVWSCYCFSNDVFITWRSDELLHQKRDPRHGGRIWKHLGSKDSPMAMVICCLVGVIVALQDL